ncbi:MAG: hypothetical protein NXI10_03520 [bacterium]|nr:hypothetical protein [bacterium]
MKVKDNYYFTEMKDSEFRKIEYETAINERKELILEINRIEKGCLLVSGIIFAWLLSAKVEDYGDWFVLAWWIPFIISGLGGIRVLALNSILENREVYLIKIEEKFEKESMEGLFTFYKKNSKKERKYLKFLGKKRKKTAVGLSSITYWTILLTLCAVLPLIIIFK